MTNHRPFEDWILAEEALLPAQQTRFDAHLSACPDCRALQAAVRRAEADLRGADFVEPMPGFPARWQARLEARRRSRRLRQVWGALALTLGGSLALLAILSLVTLAYPARALNQGLGVLLLVWANGRLIWGLIVDLAGAFSLPKLSLWATGLSLGLAGAYAGLGLIWIVSFFRFRALPAGNGLPGGEERAG